MLTERITRDKREDLKCDKCEMCFEWSEPSNVVEHEYGIIETLCSLCLDDAGVERY